MTLQAVWFKRDLRSVDHEALSRACAAGPTLCLYVIEPEYWKLGSSSNRQWLFVRDSLHDLDGQLRRLGGSLFVAQGHVVDVLALLQQEHGAFVLHSHVETGNRWTWERDKAVARWCRAQGTRWFEYAQNGVRRPAPPREQRAFGEHWGRWMASPLVPEPAQATFVSAPRGIDAGHLPDLLAAEPHPCPGRQTGGRAEGLAVLDSFLTRRGLAYRGSISSPLTAESGCSRLSAHLAYGTLSLREVAQRAEAVQAEASGAWRRSLAAFRTRLAWHDHFVQKLERSQAIEHTPIRREMAQLERPFDAVKFEAWRTGRTGWPLVDASMRYLHHHGWINFRMRAMLVSVATWSLSLPWKPVAEWLAQLFVDFEPGIHYPQVQMQSGLSAQEVLRVYNPVLQARRLDPDGHFVRRWVPELRDVSAAWIFEPWRRPGGAVPDYPAPLVDYEAAHRTVRAAVTRLRKGAVPADAAQLSLL